MTNLQSSPQSRVSRRTLYIVTALLFAIFVGLSFILDFSPGISIGENSWHFLRSMLMLFPGAFILIGLFEVWVSREVVERHLGNQSGLLGYFWVVLLASTIMAPMVVAIPVAHSLSKKGARLEMVVAFLSASTICRIPMTVFEASYLGIPFSLVRLVVSLPPG